MFATYRVQQKIPMEKNRPIQSATQSSGGNPMSDRNNRLTTYIVVAILLAIATALLFPNFSMRFQVGGEIFLRLLKMMVVPLVVASVMSGIIGLGDVRKLGKPGGYTVLYYISTTILAVTVGLLVVNIIEPGVGVIDQQALESLASESQDYATEGESPTIGLILKNLALMLFTDNLFGAAAETNLLPLIVFSIIFASMLTTMGARVASINTMILQVNDALMSFVLLLMKIAPLGIFCLVAARFGEAQAKGEFLDVIQQTGWYVVTVLVGLSIHGFLTVAMIYWFFTGKNPYRLMLQMAQALLTAFSTASSSASLPVTMECAVENAGISKRSTEFVLPLGATINMDGTALYEAVAAIFIAQAIGIDLSLTQQLIIAVTATLAAIGAAGIPEAGLVTMLIVLNAVGLPVEYLGLILAVDWLLDRFRTAVNVLGDSVGAGVLERSFEDVPSKVGTEARSNQSGSV
jgi:solute carrier family 1 (high affinity glutamate transporter) protein 1